MDTTNIKLKEFKKGIIEYVEGTYIVHASFRISKNRFLTIEMEKDPTDVYNTPIICVYIVTRSSTSGEIYIKLETVHDMALQEDIAQYEGMVGIHLSEKNRYKIQKAILACKLKL